MTVKESIGIHPLEVSLRQLKGLTLEELDQIHLLFNSVPDTIIKMAEKTERISLDLDRPVQLTNIKNVLAQKFDNDCVQLTLIYHMIPFRFIYPEILIDYICDHEGEFYDELMGLVYPSAQAVKYELGSLFTRVSDENFDLAAGLEVKSGRTLKKFVLTNFLVSWLLTTDLSATLGEVMNKGLSFEKIDDDLIRVNSYNEIIPCITDLTNDLERFLFDSWVDKNTDYIDSNNVLKDGSIDDYEGISNLLMDEKLRKDFSSLLNVTAFEVIAYLKSSVYKNNSSSIRIYEASFNLIHMLSMKEDFKKYLFLQYPTTNSVRKGWNATADREADSNSLSALSDSVSAVLNFTNYVPNAVLNRTSLQLIEYIEKHFERINWANYVNWDPVNPHHKAYHALAWLIFFSFPGHELFGSEKVRSALLSLENKGEEFLNYSKDYYGLDLNMLDTLVQWHEHNTAEWEIPVSLFFNLHYDEGKSFEKHAEACQKWFDSMKKNI